MKRSLSFVGVDDSLYGTLKKPAFSYTSPSLRGQKLASFCKEFENELIEKERLLKKSLFDSKFQSFLASFPSDSIIDSLVDSGYVVRSLKGLLCCYTHFDYPVIEFMYKIGQMKENCFVNGDVVAIFEDTFHFSKSLHSGNDVSKNGSVDELKQPHFSFIGKIVFKDTPNNSMFVQLLENETPSTDYVASPRLWENESDAFKDWMIFPWYVDYPFNLMKQALQVLLTKDLSLPSVTSASIPSSISSIIPTLSTSNTAIGYQPFNPKYLGTYLTEFILADYQLPPKVKDPVLFTNKFLNSSSDEDDPISMEDLQAKAAEPSEIFSDQQQKLDDDNFWADFQASLSFHNEEKMEILKQCVNRKLSIVSGLWGTGKTLLIGILVKLMLTLNPSVNILICSFNDLGVDRIMKDLHKIGMSEFALRIGNSMDPFASQFLEQNQQSIVRDSFTKRTGSYPQSASLEGKFRENFTYSTLKNHLDFMRQYDSRVEPPFNGDNGTDKSTASTKDGKDQQRELLDNYRDNIVCEIFQNCRVICSTYSDVASARLLNPISFPVVILDDCSTVFLPEALAPILRGSKQLILFGNPMQKPMTCINEHDLARASQELKHTRRSPPFELSLFQRFMHKFSRCVNSMTLQYRMPRKISQYFTFYLAKDFADGSPGDLTQRIVKQQPSTTIQTSAMPIINSVPGLYYVFGNCPVKSPLLFIDMDYPESSFALGTNNPKASSIDFFRPFTVNNADQAFMVYLLIFSLTGTNPLLPPGTEDEELTEISSSPFIGECKLSDILIICPYRNQLRMLRNQLGKTTPEVLVCSIEESHGFERDIVIYVSVKNLSLQIPVVDRQTPLTRIQNSIGSFLNFQFVMGQARRMLIIIGNTGNILSSSSNRNSSVKNVSSSSSTIKSKMTSNTQGWEHFLKVFRDVIIKMSYK